MGVSVVSRLGKWATPYLSQNKAVHTRWTAFCFSPFRCAILTLLQSNSLTIRDGICGQIPIPSLRSLRIPPLPPTKPALEKVWVFCLPRDENLGSALASTERAPLGVSVVSRLGKCATPCLSQNKAVHTRWTAFCFSPFRCAILTLLQSNSLTIRDGICKQIPIPSLRSLRIPPLPPKKEIRTLKKIRRSYFFVY